MLCGKIVGFTPIWRTIFVATHNLQNQQPRQSYRCVYWKYVTSSWSDDGCQMAQHTAYPTCLCNHLTNFALLVVRMFNKLCNCVRKNVAFRRLVQRNIGMRSIYLQNIYPTPRSFSLKLVNYIGSGLSIAFLLTVALLILLEK